MRSDFRLIRNNFLSLYGMMIAQIIFPLLVFPYLTRVLTESDYGVVVFVRTCMQYVVLIIEYGFMYSGTKKVAEIHNAGSREELGALTGSILQAKIMLAGASVIVPILFYFGSPILRGYETYLVASYISVVLYSFLPDFLFRGLEIMHVITIRFLLSKGVSTVLTFLLVRGHDTMLLIPIIDLAGTIIALIATFLSMRKRGLLVLWVDFGTIIKRIQEGFTYFISTVASTQFNAICVLVIGMSLGSVSVAHWGVVMQVVLAIQGFYSPIANGVYPYMVRTKNTRLIRKVLLAAIPVLLIGSVLGYLLSEKILLILAGEKYLNSSYLLRLSIPLIVIAFPATLFGWPLLGALGLENKVTKSTVIALIVQVALLGVSVILNSVSLVTVMIIRTSADFTMMLVRICVFNKFRKLQV